MITVKVYFYKSDEKLVESVHELALSYGAGVVSGPYTAGKGGPPLQVLSRDFPERKQAVNFINKVLGKGLEVKATPNQ